MVSICTVFFQNCSSVYATEDTGLGGKNVLTCTYIHSKRQVWSVPDEQYQTQLGRLTRQMIIISGASLSKE